MKKYTLLPISFSNVKNTLHYANLIAQQHDTTLKFNALLSGLNYNREYDFGALDYDEGIRKC
jgi:hypothetical protein